MAPRLNKRQQRELEELEALSAGVTPIDSDSEEEQQPPAKGPSGFAALLAGADDEDGESDSEVEKQTKSKKSKKKPKKKKGASVSATPTVPTPSIVQPTPASNPRPSSSPPAPNPQPQPGSSKKEWKALKKQKAKEKKDDRDDIDKALEELSLKYVHANECSRQTTDHRRTRRYQDAPSQASSSKGKASTSAMREWHTLLAVSVPNLDPDAEMRKFFGAKVVAAAKNTAGASSSGRRPPQVDRSNLTKPRPGWWPAKLREGLTSRALTEEEAKGKGLLEDGEEKWWTVEYSRRYKSVTLTFMRTVLSGDPEGLYRIVRQVPWHGDTLLQMAELYSHREEHSTAADFIDRALFTYERAFVGAFNLTTGTHRLDFDRVENRPFFLAIHRQVIDLQRRGVFRTAFEFARLLYSLDPWSDPHGALLHLDFLAIKAGMHQWLLDVQDALHSTPAAVVHHLPGWAYARALALRVKNDATADTALQQAIRDFPSVIPLLADKADIALPGEVRGREVFRVYVKERYALFRLDAEALVHLLSHLYVQRSFSLWKDPGHSAWFAAGVQSAVDSGKLPQRPTSSAAYTAFSARAPSFAPAVYRHVLVLSASAGAQYQGLLAFLPAGAVRGNALACDPLPPAAAVSQYDDAFFKGAEEAFGEAGRGRRSAAAERRLMERLVPDPAFRREMQGFFDAHPRLRQQFPGGVVQFAQMAGEMPEEALQDMMLALQQDMEGRADDDDGMGREMPADEFVDVLLHFEEQGQVEVGGEDEWVDEEEDVGDANRGTRGVRDGGFANEEGEGEGEGGDGEGELEGSEEEDDDDDDEGGELAPGPVRVLRNFLGRFWPRTAGRGDSGSSSEDEDGEHGTRNGRPARDDDVD
ncbi:transcriptional repressor TCF25-domain-containing protein [Amylostereum chailletii]|nr:transcriptional repressor TCF25-domain-containing protein [Amylostereum chailletii]